MNFDIPGKCEHHLFNLGFMQKGGIFKTKLIYELIYLMSQ